MYHTFLQISSRVVGAVRASVRRVVSGQSAPATGRPIPAATSTPPATVMSVDDPDRPIRLVRAVGVLGPDSIAELLGSWQDLTAPHHVHVDVEDASIVDVATMHQLGSALDRLERQRIGVRIVGIDPSHPAFAS